MNCENAKRIIILIIISFLKRKAIPKKKTNLKITYKSSNQKFYYLKRTKNHQFRLIMKEKIEQLSFFFPSNENDEGWLRKT